MLFFIPKVQMFHVQKRMAFQQGEGALPHAPEKRAGHCQGETLTPELQDVLRSSNGESQRGI